MKKQLSSKDFRKIKENVIIKVINSGINNRYINNDNFEVKNYIKLCLLNEVLNIDLSFNINDKKDFEVFENLYTDLYISVKNIYN